ncbi:MAG TPA: nucleotidyltransferase family protein [Gemmatimonadales bacterium]
MVLAAGDSSRLGCPKQLAPHEGLPLVARAARAALEAGAAPVVVVLGAHAEAARATLSDLPVIPLVNPEWSRGMGTSIATGVQAILGHAPPVDGVLVMLVDQPLVNGTAVRRLLDTWTSSAARSRDGLATIAAAAYTGTIGVPAVFGRGHFDALCSLPAEAGAARLLRQADVQADRVVMPEAALDVDTPNDLERLRVLGLSDPRHWSERTVTNPKAGCRGR